VFKGIVIVAAVLVLASLVPWPLLVHLSRLLHTSAGQRAVHAAIFVLILFAVFRLPVLLVRRRRPLPPAPRRRTTGRKPAGG
jgi:hypothetical protein